MASSTGGAVPSAGAVPFIGARISLLSKSEVRYEGSLSDIDTEEQTVVLSDVVSYGTEGRAKALGLQEFPPSNQTFRHIRFRGSDIKHLNVEPGQPRPSPLPQDPAIVSQGSAYNGPPGMQFQYPQQGMYPMRGPPYYPGPGMYMGPGYPMPPGMPMGPPGSQPQFGGAPPTSESKQGKTEETTSEASKGEEKKENDKKPESESPWGGIGSTWGDKKTWGAPTEDSGEDGWGKPSGSPAAATASPKTKPTPGNKPSQDKGWGQAANASARADKVESVGGPGGRGRGRGRGRGGGGNAGQPGQNNGQSQPQPQHQNQHHHQQYYPRGRGGMRGGRGGRGRGRTAWTSEIQGEFDFEAASSKFDKEALFKEYGDSGTESKAVGGEAENSAPDGGASPAQAASGTEGLEEAMAKVDVKEKIHVAPKYDKSTSFFDNLSSTAYGGGEEERPRPSDQRQKDFETFGAVHAGGYRGRGRGRGRYGGGGYRGGGQGQRGGFVHRGGRGGRGRGFGGNHNNSPAPASANANASSGANN